MARQSRMVRTRYWRLGWVGTSLYLLVRSLFRYFVSGQSVFGRDTDNATFLHAATKDYRDRPYERLTGPIWQRLARRWGLIVVPLVLAVLGPLWLRLYLGTVVLAFIGWQLYRAWLWFSSRSDRAELVYPTWETVCRVLNHRYRQRDAKRSVVLPRGFDRRELADGEVPEPVRINLPTAGVIEDRLKKSLALAVGQKLGMTDPLTEWSLKGSAPYVLVRPRPLPPRAVTWATVARHLDKLEIDTPLVGLGNGNAVVTLDMANDSPHVLISGGSGTGKSVMLKCVLSQRMHRGTGLIVLDYKRWSHRWAHDLPGCLYFWRIEEIHEACLSVAAELHRRIEADESEHDSFTTVDFLVEEANALIPQLRNYWKSIKGPEDPTVSPAIEAIQQVVFMGREMRMHVFLAGQRASANVFGAGGGDARESFQTRMLAKWTRQTWKMLAGSTPYVRFPGGPRGIWARVQDDEVEIVRVPFFTDKEARTYAMSGAECPDTVLSGRPDRPAVVSADVPPALVSLSEALPMLPGPDMKLDALRKASQRAGFPAQRGQVGPAAVYELADLQAWKAARDSSRRPALVDPFENARRPAVIYAYDVAHPFTGQPVLGYVGQTVQRLEERDEQHRDVQPWYDTVLPESPRVIWSGEPTAAELDALELGFIRDLKPLYNFEGQEHATHRITKPDAVSQRHARDRSAGLPLWSPVARHWRVS
jgi:hypothetical protein